MNVRIDLFLSLPSFEGVVLEASLDEASFDEPSIGEFLLDQDLIDVVDE